MTNGDIYTDASGAVHHGLSSTSGTQDNDFNLFPPQVINTPQRPTGDIALKMLGLSPKQIRRAKIRISLHKAHELTRRMFR